MNKSGEGVIEMRNFRIHGNVFLTDCCRKLPQAFLIKLIMEVISSINVSVSGGNISIVYHLVLRPLETSCSEIELLIEASTGHKDAKFY